MRVAIAGSQPRLWVVPPTNPFEHEAVDTLLSERAIMCMPLEQWDEVNRAIAEGVQDPGAPEFMQRFADLLRTVPMSEKTGSRVVDARLDDLAQDVDGTPLGRAAVDRELKSKVMERRNALDHMRTRSSVYDAMVRPFAATATKVRVLDPWAAHEISAGRDAAPWLVEQLVADGISHIEFLSTRDDDYPQGVAVDAFRSLWQRYADSGLTLRLVMADPHGDAHDRQLRFFYPDGTRKTPVVSLGRGVSVFAEERFVTPPTIVDSSGSLEAAEKREAVILHSMGRKTTIEYPEPPPRRPRRSPADAMRRSTIDVL